MNKLNTLLTERLKKGEKSSKMAEMGKQSVQGNLTSFSGIFSVSDLSKGEKDSLETLLHTFSAGTENLEEDLEALSVITSEVKAISNQATILHGERIKRAHAILVRYRDGAFTNWLLAAYGNRQTPYNFMQYYEFCEAMPKTLRPQIEAMPRQAIYTLASREGPLDLKCKIVENYAGESKTQLMETIREVFPLASLDGRAQNIGENLINALKRVSATLSKKKSNVTSDQRQELKKLLKEIELLV